LIGKLRLTCQNPARAAIFLAAAAIVGAAAARYYLQPSFWLDEAFIAVSVRGRSPLSIFGPLEYGQLFPRVYLAAITALRHAFGYHIWVLRLLPTLCFILGTLLWARLLDRRSRGLWPLGLLAAALFVGSGYWLDQAIQLKQYTLEVVLALIPFILSDRFFSLTLREGKRRAALAALALPIVLSYTYPIALGARLLGWYLYEAKRSRDWRLKRAAVLTLGLAITAGLVGIWATDIRFNLTIRDQYLNYWDNCILSLRLQKGVATTLRLISNFLWGWHGRMPPVTAGMVLLQGFGIYYLIKKWRNANQTDEASDWGSRSLGSLLVLAGVIAASAILSITMCAGRLTLFAQVHTQIIALEGAIFILSKWGKSKLARVFIYILIIVTTFYSVRAYWRSVRAGAAENLRPIIHLINPESASTLWVHPCSTAQVQSLPDLIPVERVLLGADRKWPQKGEKAWIIWSHMSGDFCQQPMNELRARARNWQVVYEGNDTGLALAEF
jgi:hypothetical protein